MSSASTEERIVNPLWQREARLLRQCAAAREHCLQVHLRHSAASDLHDPALRADQPFSREEVHACLQVFNVLAQPTWSERDLAILEGFFPYAWRGLLFRECVPEGRQQIRRAIDEAFERRDARVQTVRNSR